MIRNPQSGYVLPPRPRRPIIGIDEAPDYASGIISTSGTISETTMASFLIDSSGRADRIENSNHILSPNTAALLRQKQEEARVAIFCLNQFIFQAGNLYRGKRLTRDEQSILKESANRVGLSIDIVDALLDHTSNSNAVVNYCMKSNDAFARKIKEDRHLSLLLEKDTSDQSEGSFNIKNSIWRVFMHKIVQQVLRDHGMDIGDVLNKSSSTSKLYEEALRGRESEYIISSAAERERIHRDYTEERKRLALSEDEIKSARRHAASQISYQQNRPFHDLLYGDDVPLLIEGGHIFESREDDMSLLTCMEGGALQQERTLEPLDSKLDKQEATIAYTPLNNQRRNVEAESWIENDVVEKQHEISMNFVSPTGGRTSEENEQIHRVSEPINQSTRMREENNIDRIDDGDAPPSAVKRALALFENQNESKNNQHQQYSHSASKVGRGSNSKIASVFEFFEKGKSKENETIPELKTERSSEHTAIQTNSLFDVFSTPKKNSFTERNTVRAASTSKIARVKQSQIVAFENEIPNSKGNNQDEVYYSKRRKKLNPEVRRLFDVSPEMPLEAEYEASPIPYLSTRGSSLKKNKLSETARNMPIAERVVLMELQPSYTSPNKEFHTNNASRRESYVLPHSRRKSLSQDDTAYTQKHDDSIDAAFDIISECSDPIEDIEDLKHGWKSHSIPPTSCPRKQTSQYPTVKFDHKNFSPPISKSLPVQEYKITSQSPKEQRGRSVRFNDENLSPSTYQELRSSVGRVSSQSPKDRNELTTVLGESPGGNARNDRDAFSNPQKSAMDKMLKYAQTPPKGQTPRKKSNRSVEMREKFLANMNYSSEEQSSNERDFGNSMQEEYQVKLNQEASLNDIFISSPSDQYGVYKKSRQGQDHYHGASPDQVSDQSYMNGAASFSSEQFSMEENGHYQYNQEGPEEVSREQGACTTSSNEQVYLNDMTSSLPTAHQGEYRGPGFIDNMLSSMPDNPIPADSQSDQILHNEPFSTQSFLGGIKLSGSKAAFHANLNQKHDVDYEFRDETFNSFPLNENISARQEEDESVPRRSTNRFLKADKLSRSNKVPSENNESKQDKMDTLDVDRQENLEAQRSMLFKSHQTQSVYNDESPGHKAQSPTLNFFNQDFVRAKSMKTVNTKYPEKLGIQSSFKASEVGLGNIDFHSDSEINRMDPFQGLNFLENEGTFAASTLTYSSASADESEFEAFNFFDPKDSKTNRPRGRAHHTEGQKSRKMATNMNKFSQNATENSKDFQTHFKDGERLLRGESQTFRTPLSPKEETLPAPPSGLNDEIDNFLDKKILQANGRKATFDIQVERENAFAAIRSSSSNDNTFGEFIQSNSKWFEPEQKSRSSGNNYSNSHDFETQVTRTVEGARTPKAPPGRTFVSDSSCEENVLEKDYHNLPSKPSGEEAVGESTRVDEDFEIRSAAMLNG
jgi:hypothetical protein